MNDFFFQFTIRGDNSPEFHNSDNDDHIATIVQIHPVNEAETATIGLRSEPLRIIVKQEDEHE